MADEIPVPDNPIIVVTKVLPKGAVQLPLEVRERLGLKPGTSSVREDSTQAFQRVVRFYKLPGVCCLTDYEGGLADAHTVIV